MSTEPFPTFSPTSIIGLLNTTIGTQKKMFTDSDGTIKMTPFDNKLLVITAFFTNLKLLNITSRAGYMGKSKDIREVVTGSYSAAKECELIFTRVPSGITEMGYPAQKSGASVCWLCGFTINEMSQAITYLYPTAPNWTDQAPNAHAANAPECEHIVPAGAAMIYLDIPNRKRGGYEDLYVNYEWSHKFCNATASDGGEGEGGAGKSDKLFFNMLDEKDGSLLSPTVNIANINRWLLRLAQTTLMSFLVSSKYANMPPNPANAWAADQGFKMQNRLQKVCNYIVSKRANYPTIFGQGVQGSDLAGDGLIPPSPYLGPPQNQVAPGVMIGDLLNVARNVSIVFNDLVSKNNDPTLLEALVVSQNMMHLRHYYGGEMLAAINEKRTDLTTQKAFFNENGNGILNGVMPSPFLEILKTRPILESEVDLMYNNSMAIWTPRLDPLNAHNVAQIQRSSLSGGGLSPSVFLAKRKKTRRNKPKEKRTKRNKNSKK